MAGTARQGQPARDESPFSSRRTIGKKRIAKLTALQATTGSCNSGKWLLAGTSAQLQLLFEVLLGNLATEHWPLFSSWKA